MFSNENETLKHYWNSTSCFENQFHSVMLTPSGGDFTVT